MEPFVEFLQDHTLSSGLLDDAAAVRVAAMQLPGWSPVTWAHAVKEWFVGTLDVTFPPLYDRWVLFKPLFGDDVATAIDVFKAVVEADYHQGYLYTWPPGNDTEVLTMLMNELPLAPAAPVLAPAGTRYYPRNVSIRKRPRYVPVQTTVELRRRNGRFDANRARRNQEVTRAWTQSSFVQIQEYMRHPVNHGAGREPAESLLRYMERTASRAPRGAISGVRYLYRHLNHPHLSMLQATGRLPDPGFMAFTFRKASYTVRVAVSAVPAGTPWIWYGHRHNPPSALDREDEVLLPPGVLTVVTVAAQDEPLPPDSVSAKYTPNRHW